MYNAAASRTHCHADVQARVLATQHGHRMQFQLLDVRIRTNDSAQPPRSDLPQEKSFACRE